ncbi:MAG: Ribonuclease HII [Alphaproteobacteria bacterium MarineAlpha4_Bin2]|nr:MAG: Ribonuclease HII [Alphaproteobacteria bacterium MarineAlpha4_Bin2]
MPDFKLEFMSRRPVAGIDEAGRGPWAGPVVAAAAILPDNLSTELCQRIDDSKKLKRRVREVLLSDLEAVAFLGVGVAMVSEIDDLNILQATMLAMCRAVDDLPIAPATALVDGNFAPDLACMVRTVLKGDTLSLSIAAASIVAKVTRDRMMVDLAERFPGYGWERNAGYGTQEHREAIGRLGVTPVHRRSFAPIRDALTIYGQ